MLAKLFKAFVGDKSANDIKEVQPVVDRVKEIEPSLAGLSADDLRAKSTDLRSLIQDHVAGELDMAEAVPGVRITATCRVTGRTGIEMEAMTAVSVAALTIYDMCKAVDRGMVIGAIRLTHKSGGKSGDFNAE